MDDISSSMNFDESEVFEKKENKIELINKETVKEKSIEKVKEKSKEEIP